MSDLTKKLEILFTHCMLPMKLRKCADISIKNVVLKRYHVMGGLLKKWSVYGSLY